MPLNRRRPSSGEGKNGCSPACSSARTAGVERSCQRDSPAGVTTYKEDRPSGSQSQLSNFLLRKAGLNNVRESLGVIEKVDEPTSWCAGMVVVPQKGGEFRICVDYCKLN